MTPGSTQQRPSNEVKFETGNPIVQRMIGGYFETLGDIVGSLRPATVLDAGCGEGETIARLDGMLGDRISAVDTNPYCVKRTAERHPMAEVTEGSIKQLRFPDHSFDLVLCLEVIEHIDHPGIAVRELARVAARDVVVSVPFEPWFRIGSLLRGKYVRSLGNHPEHVNHYNRKSLVALLEPSLELTDIRVAFPWLIAHGRVRG